MIGLARDGRIVYGPYNEDGELWTKEDHDICNGVYLEDGSYAYVSTTYYPYNIGCWGQNELNCVGPFESNASQPITSTAKIIITTSLTISILYLF